VKNRTVPILIINELTFKIYIYLTMYIPFSNIHISNITITTNTYILFTLSCIIVYYIIIVIKFYLFKFVSDEVLKTEL